jgi:hypothetical protein
MTSNLIMHCDHAVAMLCAEEKINIAVAILVRTSKPNSVKRRFTLFGFDVS